MPRRLSTPLAVAVLVLPLAATTAFADVTLQTRAALAGASYPAVLGAPHHVKSPAPALLILAQAATQHIPAAPVFRIGALTIEAPWARATPAGAKVAGAYMTITNNGTESDRLIGGSAAFAGRFEVHEMRMEGGTMRMRQLENGLEVKPGETVELKPGGYHVMFMDLQRGLQQGESVKGTLLFEKAGRVEVEYRVAPIGGSAGPADTGHKHH